MNSSATKHWTSRDGSSNPAFRTRPLAAASRSASRIAGTSSRFSPNGGVALKLETDGSRIDDAAADRLAALAVQCVQISVDGATAATHARVRPGSSFAAATSAITRLVARGQPPQLVFVPNRFNIHEAVAAFDLAVCARLQRVRDRADDAHRSRRGCVGPTSHATTTDWQRAADALRERAASADARHRAVDLSVGHRH